MKATKLARIGGGVVAMSLLLATQASATIAFDTPDTTPGNQTAGPWNLGQVFTANQDITITALGAFDAGHNGWGSETITVAIYDFNLQSIVGSSAMFNSTTPGSIQTGSSYAFQAVTPFSLGAGTTYMIVASGIGGSQNPNYNSSGSSSLISINTGGILSFPGPTAYGTYYSTYTGTPAFPTTADGGPVGRYGGGSFDFTPVPEAATFGAAAIGLLGLVYVVRYARIRRTLSNA